MKFTKLRHLKKSIFIPILSVLLFSLLIPFSFFKTGESQFYDLFLHLSPGPEQDERLVLLNIDDLAIARVGMFPWSRSIMADGLILMKEMGAGAAVFDIEYTEESPMGLNGEFLHKSVPKVLDTQFQSVSENTIGLFQAIASGNISLKEAEEYIYQLQDLQDSAKQNILKTVQSIARDNDSYFGQSVRYFGNAYFTVNMLIQREDEYSQELKDWVRENLSIPVKVSGDALPLKAVDIRPAIAPIVRNSIRVGFPNVKIDSDGVRRRINLIGEYEGTYFPQLSFQAVYDILGQPELELSRDRLVLKDAEFGDGEVRDIRIPLDPKGLFVINWPRSEFEESFKQLSYYYLVLHQEQEKLLVENLNIMNDAGYLNYHQGGTSPLNAWEYAENLRQDMLEGGDLNQMEDYREVRKVFISEAEAFLHGEASSRIKGRIDQILANPDVSESQKIQYQEIRSSVENSFSETAAILDNLVETRKILSDSLTGAICYIGWTGTATTDRGVNPFDATYDNVGTHASVANSILQEDFIDILPVWWAILAAVLFVMLYYRVQLNLTPGRSIISGLGFMLFILASSLILFRSAGLYFPVFLPMLATATTFVALTIISLLSTSKEKTFIRNAFGQYLSNEVINDLLENPDKLNLGGEKKLLTAIFTDVKGFSTISEAMDPTDLVTLLNMYLTEMSDIIMDERGTIDKFEGDAIISFFGAPTTFNDHAYRACLSAVKMKRAEAIMNKKISSENLSPYPLNTRIGINTGDMVVGNMGTAKKMDYTMMGNAVNLAARLEGVNKRYGTWLLMSETTWDAGGQEFATRKLDRVRVVGINTPVRLFELVEEKDHLDSRKEDVLNLFEEGLTLFESKDWSGAEKVFRNVLTIDKEDGPAQYYLSRCEKYKKTPPRKDWDGVYNLTEK